MGDILKFLLISFSLTACSDNSQKDKTSNSADSSSKYEVGTNLNSDTIVVNRKTAVFIEPDSIRLEERKKEVGEEDFYIGADDYLFYMHTSLKFLDSVKLTTLIVKDKKFVKFVSSDNNSQVISINKLPELWSIYLFDPSKKAKQVDITNMDEEYKNYFIQ